ncbi:helix-turn-helix transcriptional regulator [Streptomyces sp. TLI_053]|uniref:helix-turn-helix domain-containing protein n=1 Tax=Streptomyces sp. TLI_053 TaxID=1855352 RepID=UPI000B8545D5|nr:helix-turn-helix transcriptional regulator [Streptomyces sp. TLI_053]
MSTDHQQGRVALGARLRELRTEADLSGRALAGQLGWVQSKVSKLETGRQTPSPADLDAWASATGSPGAAVELRARLRGLETQYRSWNRQLSGGHRERQEAAVLETRRTQVVRAFESARIPGLLQTADYARHMLAAGCEFIGSPRDTEDAVRTRIRRQEALYDAGRRFHFLVWEAALYVTIGPPEVMAAQLDRLVGLLGLDTVDLGIIPLGSAPRRTPAHGFWIYDERLVIVETINAELWLDSPADIALYRKAWDWLAESAVTGHQAHRLIGRAGASLTPR